MAKTSKIEVDKKSISIIEQNSEDYICLTDMVRGEEGEDHIRNWMRNRNTVEFIGLWETLHNPDFKPVEFDTFRKPLGRVGRACPEYRETQYRPVQANVS